MKRNMKFLILFIGLVASSVLNPKQAEAQGDNLSFQVFYDALSPYGEWVDYPDLGYVWLPNAGPDFVPYSTDGQWIYTNYGWTWASNYEWGWAPFHYGRWDFDNNMGWYWFPGNEWGPAWVSWRRGDGYFGWEPMQPGLSLSLSFGREYNPNRDHWTFVRDRDFEQPDVYRYHVDNNEHERIVRNSTIIDNTHVDRTRNTTYVTGPSRDAVQQVTGRKINVVTLHENDRPGQELNGRQMRLYRPQVSRTVTNERKPAPSRVVKMNEVRRPSERISTGQPGNQNSGINRRQQQPNIVSPQNSDNQKVKVTQPKNINASDNNQRQQQRKKIYRVKPNTIQQQKPQEQPQPQAQPQPQPQRQQQQAQPQPQPRQQQQAQPQQQRQQPQAQPQQWSQKEAAANPSKRVQRRNVARQAKMNRVRAKQSKSDAQKR